MGRLIYLRTAEARAGNQDKNRDARVNAAGNPNTPAETLTLLARDTSVTVRCAVAGNPRTAPETLAELARDPNPTVRWLVAWHPSTPANALDALARDGAPDDVRLADAFPAVRQAALAARRERTHEADRDR